jgi:hypothetical protein
MHHFFVYCAILSVGWVVFTQAYIASHVVSHVTDDGRSITYTCPDATEKTVPYRVGEDMVAYVKPSPIYPFEPVDISQRNPRILYVCLLSIGTCLLWAYIAYLAALNEGN